MDETKYSAMHKKAHKLLLLVEELHSELDGYEEELFEFNRFHRSGDIVDAVSGLEMALRGRIDGRPKPLDFSKDFAPAKIFYSEEDYKEKLKDLHLWAECLELGFDDIARIGGEDFNRDQCILLRNFIDATMDWHDRAKSVCNLRINPNEQSLGMD